MLKTDFYTNDIEFQKLLVRDPSADLTVAALEFARDFLPEIDFEQSQEWMRNRAREVMTRVARATCDRQILSILSESLGHTWDIGGDSDCYHDPRASFINCVIESRRGLPITTSAIYMGVARHLGVDLRGVPAPMHFLSRLDADEGPLFIDTFRGGQILTLKETVEMLTQMTQQSDEFIVRFLEPANTRTILIRMLQNLKSLFSTQEKWDSAWKIQHRIATLSPASYREQRDLALISVRANRPGFAVDLLHQCLQVCPDGDKHILRQHLAQAQRAVPIWN